MRSSTHSFDFRSATLFGILSLFFFQLITDFVEAVYAFGLMGTGIPPEIVFVLFLFMPVLLLFLRKGLRGRGLVVLAGVVLVARVVEAMLDTRSSMLVAGIGVGVFLVYFPSLLWSLGQERETAKAINLVAGLAFGLALVGTFRALGSGVDHTTDGGLQWKGWLLAAVAAWLLTLEARRAVPEEGHREQKPSPPFGRIAGLSLGIAAALVMLYFAFASPNVIARWTGASFLLVVVVVMLSLIFFLLAARTHLVARLTPRVVLAWNILFVLALLFTILPHQLNFPPDAGGYPFYEPPTSPLSVLPLILTLVLFPVILVDFHLFSRELIAQSPSSRALGGAFSLGSLFILVMIFGQVFTTVYDYIPVVGPFFRDKFWLVFLTAGVVLTLPVLLVRKGVARGELNWSKAFAGLMILVAVAAMAGPAISASRPPTPPQEATSLRILTYNIQQGYSEDGLKNYTGQLELIAEVGADLIGLQESDTNRIAGGNSDVVRYFTERLNMHSYYGPKVVPGTFGIAVLSRYPLENPRTFYMYSEAEQTATIHAQIRVDGKVFNVFVTHLGNGGPIVQQEAILSEVAGLENVILMGDFNFRPDTDQYRLTTGVLEDAWLLRWPEGIDDQGLYLEKRIDHIFLSPGTTVLDARYLLSPHSDHPAFTIQITWE